MGLPARPIAGVGALARFVGTVLPAKCAASRAGSKPGLSSGRGRQGERHCSCSGDRLWWRKMSPGAASCSN
jgi:hypothetical protein